MSRLHLLVLLAYATVAVVALLVLWLERSRRGAALRWGRQLFIALVVGLTLFAGVTQRDLWPFSAWALMTGAPTPTRGEKIPHLRFAAVDGFGREYPVDYRAVEPFAVEELMAWLRAYFLTLPAASQDSAASFLLGRIELARLRVGEGRSPGTSGRWLGPLRAPFHQLHPAQWPDAASVPATPFVGLRLYGESWTLEERAQDSTRVTRRLLYQYPVEAAP